MEFLGKNDVIINVACTANVWFNRLTAILLMKARIFLGGGRTQTEQGGFF